MSMPLKSVGDYLRMADKEIKNGNLENAMGYINLVFQMEQKSVYAKAYRERIVSLMEAQGLSRIEAEQRAYRATVMETPASAPSLAPETPAPVPVQQKQTVPPLPTPSAPQKTTLPPAAPAAEQKKSVPAAAPSGKVSQIRRSAAASDAYKSMLTEIWRDGSVSPDEQSRIDSMRETFAITPDEHTVIEKDVRLMCYLQSIREEWRKGITDFGPQRKRFLITDQEQLAIEPRVFQLLQSLQSNGSVLVLDDEEPFLTIIKSILDEGGYYCFTAKTGEEGLVLLETMTPDIVICDINFSKPNMSGFAFYEKFRSIDKFLTTPFIFLSGLDQDVLVRTGKKLGADDYLFKPLDTEMLMATIEGKLKRSRELKRAI
ncbi:MAG: response regulator [Bacteroidota bacterium]